MYGHRGRFYVLGAAGERYIIRVANPTARRVEAVVSVDGLDVIDGETADVRKRGYIVPAYGELRIEGFRVSTQQVAAFRFSSVSNSYAGRKGKARNVGVIGVALFEEQAAPEIIVQTPVQPREDRRLEEWDGDDDGWGDEASGSVRGGATGGVAGGRAGGASRTRTADKADFDRGADAPAPAAEPAPAPPARPAPRVSRSRPAPTKAKRPVDLDITADESEHVERCCAGRPQTEQRPGLGTEFGERRHSNVSFTQFVRANATQPTAMAELRYNDADGLRALGISLQPVNSQELHTRESADPFPGSRGFAQPPR